VAELKTFILEYTFTDQAEEIKFFKELKPKFLRELIYYSELFELEANRPVGDADVQAGYYKHVMERVRLFFERNSQLYNYYRSGKTNFDEQFFKRGANTQPLDMDPRFCTMHSSKLAKIQAFEQLNSYLLTALNALRHNGPDVIINQAGYKPKSSWSDTRVALIELAYAIYAKGSVSHGNAEIKDIVSALEQAFNIDLGNFYVVFQQNIRLRKKNRTVYLDESKDYLIRYMDDQDEFPKSRKENRN
jgi:hypothetical protein